MQLRSLHLRILLPDNHSPFQLPRNHRQRRIPFDPFRRQCHRAFLLLRFKQPFPPPLIPSRRSSEPAGLDASKSGLPFDFRLFLGFGENNHLRRVKFPEPFAD